MSNSKNFDQYTNPKKLTFDKMHILIDLNKSNEDQFISRSQAKKILFGLDKFQHIILDFHRVKTVGQAFIDEVFRVFKNLHPKIKIEIKHANDEVMFMIKRGLSTTSQNLITPQNKK